MIVEALVDCYQVSFYDYKKGSSDATKRLL